MEDDVEVNVDDIEQEENVVQEVSQPDGQVEVSIVEKKPFLEVQGELDLFPTDYMILVRYGDYTRQTLIEAIYKELEALRTDDGVTPQKINDFLAWVCRVFNLDMNAFNDGVALSKELSLAQQNIDDFFNKREALVVEDTFADESNG